MCANLNIPILIYFKIVQDDSDNVFVIFTIQTFKK